MHPSPSPIRTLPNRRLLTATLVVLSALALMLAIAASTVPALAGVPPAGPRSNAAPVAVSATPVATPQCTNAWDLIDVPPGEGSAALLGIDDVTWNDMWAVGVSSNKPLLKHFDGLDWTVVTPTTVITNGLLHDVSAVSTNDVWAVGHESGGMNGTHGLILHYTDTQWTKVPYPNPEEADVLYSVDAVSATEAWAVGSNEYGAGFLVLRWNGTSWTRVPTPPPSTVYDRLQGVEAVVTVTTTHVWAVGSVAQGQNAHPMIMHYDGAGWSTVALTMTGILLDVAAVSPTDIWAVGTSANSPSDPRTLAVHWDGTAWTTFPTPFPGELWGLHAHSAADIWAVGGRSEDNNAPTRMLHWDGTMWSVVQSPLLYPGGGTIYDVRMAFPYSQLWAVGANNETGTGRELIARYGPYCPNPLACQTGWNVVDTIDINPDMNALLGIDASAPDDVWAVGVAGLQGLANHWNGSYWNAASISATPDETLLWGVSAIASDDVWAVGFTQDSGSADRTLDLRDKRAAPLWDTGTVTVHWDGTAWTRIPSPNPSSDGENTLWGVDGVAPDDVWAVGITGGQGLILHWTGAAWAQVPLPPGVTVAYLQDVEAVSTKDVWAVGSSSNSPPSRAIILHWNGTVWSQVASPNPGIDPNGGNYLESIDAISANDIWAVGAYEGSSGSGSLTLHWDGNTWTHVQAPSIGLGRRLTGVSGSATNDVWAVAPPTSTLLSALHWNGSEWSVVDLPEPQDPDPWLYSVVAPSQNEVWAVGLTGGLFDSRSLVERYVTSCQTVTPTPVANTATTSPSATRTGTASSTSISTGTPTPTRTHTPSITPTVATCANNWQRGAWMPTGVCCYAHAQSGNDLYVMGGNVVGGYSNRMYRYNAQFDVWTRLADLPVALNNAAATLLDGRIYLAGGFNNTYTSGFYIYDIASNQWSAGAPLPTGMTAGAAGAHAGKVYVAGGFPNTTALYIYNIPTNSWTIGPPLPQPYSYGGYVQAGSSLYMVSGGVTQRIDLAGGGWSAGPPLPVPREHLALASDGARLFAIGGDLGNGNFTNRVDELPLASWPGGSWAPSPAFLPVAIASNSAGFYTTARAGGEIWSTGGSEWVGDASAEHTFRPLGCPTVTPTSTPGTCALAFADVPPDNTFYPFVRCLACQGIISGYPCGGTGEPCNSTNDPYFRPNNYVTRGQLAKIVSESAGFDDEIPPSQWTFSDVPYGSTFWVWVERLASRQVMAGYACGGPNEPCDGQNRPYFRPNSGATRGQLTKIVSNAARFYDLIPESRYAFTDVSPTHTFWLFVERLLLNRPGVMGGYPCGGAGEPCDGQNRPYFRPNNPLTRGQTSKIVSNTFFPGCDPPRR